VIAGYLNQVAKYEASPVLYGWAPVLAKLTFSPPFSMDAPFKVRVLIDMTLTFTVTVKGTLGTPPEAQTDTLSFNAGWGDIIKTTTKQFNTVTEITTTIGANERNCRISAADPTTEEELPGAWVEFPCRWEAKRSTYLKVVEDQASQQIMQAEGRIFCTEPLESGAKVKLDTGIIYEVVKVEPKAGLDGKEMYRVLLLGGVGA